MDSETCGVQWKGDFNGSLARWGVWQAEISKAVTTSIIWSSAQILPWVLIGWILWGIHLFLNVLLGYLKYGSLGIGQILEVGFRWYPPPFVLGRPPCDCAFWHAHSFYPFPHSMVIYPSHFKFLYQLPLPQHPQADNASKRPGLNDHLWLCF
jgi:hypothetical protein